MTPKRQLIDIFTGYKAAYETMQREKQQIDGHERKAVSAHVLACLGKSLARKVLLHHVLVKSCHDNHDESSADKLFPEVLRAHPVVKHKHAAVAVGNNSLCSLA